MSDWQEVIYLLRLAQFQANEALEYADTAEAEARIANEELEKARSKLKGVYNGTG